MEARAEVRQVVVVGDRVLEAADLGELHGLVERDLSLRRGDLECRIPGAAVRAVEAAAERVGMAEGAVDDGGVRDGRHELVAARRCGAAGDR